MLSERADFFDGFSGRWEGNWSCFLVLRFFELIFEVDSSSVDQVFKLVPSRKLRVDERGPRRMDGEGVVHNDVTQVVVGDVSSGRVHVGCSSGDSCPLVLNLFVAPLLALKLPSMIPLFGSCPELVALCDDGSHLCAYVVSSVVAPHVGGRVLLWISPCPQQSRQSPLGFVIVLKRHGNCSG